MQFSRPNQGPSRLCWRAVYFLPLLTLFCSSFVRAQDVAEAARQERARKAAEQQAKTRPHVYTDEDLKREKILTPADQTRVEARKALKNATPGQQDAQAVSADKDRAPESLGEIARRYRNEKAAREADEAAKKSFAAFPYTFKDPTFAAPAPEIVPLQPLLPKAATREQPKVTPSERSPILPLGNKGRARLSPFQPRPYIAATPAPSVNLPRIRPAPPVHPAAVPAMVVSTAGSLGVRRVQVQRGDSWWKLAERYLGSGTRWQELRRLNGRSAGPDDHLEQGNSIVIPAAANLSPTVSSATRVVVNKGDTLWSLAREHLGRGGQWSCLARANPQIADYTRLMIGSLINLPSLGEMQSCQSQIREPLKR